jgi:hypothetical protein
MTRNNRNFRLAGSAAVLVGCFLPWASVGFFSVNGIDTDDGKLVAVLAVVAGFLSLASKRIPSLLVAVLILLATGYDLINTPGVGIGLLVCVAAGAFLVWVGRTEKKTLAPTPAPPLPVAVIDTSKAIEWPGSSTDDLK